MTLQIELSCLLFPLKYNGTNNDTDWPIGGAVVSSLTLISAGPLNRFQVHFGKYSDRLTYSTFCYATALF
jgi:hypothetical protein